MYSSEYGCKGIKKAFSLFLTGVLAVNTCVMVSVSTAGIDAGEGNMLSEQITEKASSYLRSRENADHSFGNSSTINDTACASAALRMADKSFDSSESEQWMLDNISVTNFDMTARLASATGKTEYLSYFKGMQNDDGGFGLYPGYSSDVLDSVLVLEAINETGCSGNDISADALCVYLLGNAGSDGGYSYSAGNESDELLTAMAVYNLGRYFNQKNYDISLLDSSAAYLAENISDSYVDADIEKTLYKNFALMQIDDDIDTIHITEELYTAEKPDGSFAGDVQTTALAMRLIASADFENRVSVTTFNTTLSSDTANAGKSSSVQAKTLIGCKSNYSADLELVFTVFSGENNIYEKKSSVSVTSGENTIEVDSGDFILSEPGDSDIYAVAELYEGERLLKSQKIAIGITPAETVYSTEISDLSVTLDTNTAFTDTDTVVNVSYSLLYATNIEQNVEMKTTVSKDGTVIETVTENGVLVKEKNILSGKPLSFTPDTTEVGGYVIDVVCSYNGSEICRNSAVFRIAEAPEIKENESGTDDADQFGITWFGPVLSDYYVYSGRNTDIMVGVEANYYSNGIFSGKAELAVYSGEEIVAETTADITLEKGVPTYFDGKANYPVYKNEEMLSFTVCDAGTYDVYAKLYDAEGTLIAEDKRVLEVAEKPVQDIILTSGINQDQVDLAWNDISSSAESYSYQLFRKTDGGSWEPRSIWNEEEHIRVLNVYPTQPYLVEWMNTTIGETELPAGKGIFDIDPVHFSAFNADPYGVLLDESGRWKYDVIFFGTADCNGGQGLDMQGVEAVQKFIDTGRGVLFGHDTIGYGSNFNRFAEQAGLLCRGGITSRTTSVSVVKVGTLTNYPWVIRGNLTVPNTHTSGQHILDATEWITLNNQKHTDPATGATDGFYLCTKDNLAMIQTGDSTGQATDDERKILANTLFYLHQISQLTNAKDSSFYDIDAPNVPEVISSSDSTGKLVLNVSSADNPTRYDYYISANPTTDGEESVLSNVVSHDAFSGLQGFVAVVSSDPDPNPELITYAEDAVTVIGVVPASADGTAVLSVEPEDYSQPQYVHIFAVDNANNVSEEYVIPFADTSVKTEIRTDRNFYSYGDTIEINAETISAPFGQTADMRLAVCDEFGNEITVLSDSEGQIISAGTPFTNSASWQIPADTVGVFSAVISWERSGQVIASGETSFRIANEESVLNTVSSDKKIYSAKEPINLDSIISNNSNGMTENDLKLSVTVRRAGASGTETVFVHDVSSVNPDAEVSYSDAIAPSVLPAGDYQVVSFVMQNGVELASDSAEFSVVDSAASFTGSLDLTPSDDTASAEFSVTNTSPDDSENVVVKAIVYKESTTDAVFSFSRTVSIAAGASENFSETFDLPSATAGEYYGVLSVEYCGTSADLDYDGFEVADQPVTETVTTTTGTAKTTKSAAVAATISARTSPPKTGVDGISVYLWIISAVSIVCLIVLKRTGGEENE